ncbi:MAG: hypothetical protein AB7K36_07475 [Chloroflexota bacterium]
MPLQTLCEGLVVLLTAALAAGALTAAFNYLIDREWPAVVFLTLAGTASVWYGMIALVVVRAAFAAA